MSQTREVFDVTAPTYDAARSKLIPCYNDFYRWAIDLISAHATTIVDLGAGSGLLTALIRNRFPAARIHAIDFSEPMLTIARERLTSLFGDRHNVTFHQADYTRAALPSEACAIVSSLSIHHLEDPEKQRLFRTLHAALKPGGVFINADHTAGPTVALEDRYQQIWMSQIRAAGATEEEIAASLYRQQQDRRSPVEAQLAWMRDAGFTDVDCWYKDNCFAVMSGARA